MIFIDASRYSNTAHRTGVENYSYFLINELVKQAPEAITLVSPRAIDLPVEQIIIPFPRLWTQVRLSWEVLRNKKINNLFIPSHLMPLIHPKNTIITLHDVAFKRFPEAYGFLSRWYLNWGTRRAVRRARHIIVPSETTKKDLIQFYKADPNKITVIPLGFAPPEITLNETDIENALEEYHLKSRHYFLFVGRIETKKNLVTLIRAFEGIRDKHPHLKLVLAGKLGVGGEAIVKSIKDPNIIITGYLSEKTKWSLMANTLAFVFPSLFEGFGLPLLEAMAAGVPIIASRLRTSYEIAKDNALFFEPKDVQTLARHLKTLAEQKDWWPHLIQNHEATLANYTWERCAEETMKVLFLAESGLA